MAVVAQALAVAVVVSATGPQGHDVVKLCSSGCPAGLLAVDTQGLCPEMPVADGLQGVSPDSFGGYLLVPAHVEHGQAWAQGW